LDSKTAIYYPRAFDRKGLNLLENHVDLLIAVSEEEARRFACNAIVLKKNVIMNDGCPKIRRQLEALGFLSLKSRYRSSSKQAEVQSVSCSSSRTKIADLEAGNGQISPRSSSPMVLSCGLEMIETLSEQTISEVRKLVFVRPTLFMNRLGRIPNVALRKFVTTRSRRQFVARTMIVTRLMVGFEVELPVTLSLRCRIFNLIVAFLVGI
jgi:hypothetical protein